MMLLQRVHEDSISEITAFKLLTISLHTISVEALSSKDKYLVSSYGQ